MLKVSASGYYEWPGRPESQRETRNRELAKLIAAIHKESRGTYGWPRVHAELVLGLGEQVNRERAARLMRQAGLQGTCRRKGRKNLVNAATEEDLVHRQFNVGALDRLWLTDITGHPTAEGKLYCAAVMDACSRRIIGWSIDSRQETGWSSMRSAWPFSGAARPESLLSCIRITERNTRLGHSVSACARPGCSGPWGQSATATTIP